MKKDLAYRCWDGEQADAVGWRESRDLVEHMQCAKGWYAGKGGGVCSEEFDSAGFFKYCFLIFVNHFGKQRRTCGNTKDGIKLFVRNTKKRINGEIIDKHKKWERVSKKPPHKAKSFHFVRRHDFKSRSF